RAAPSPACRRSISRARRRPKRAAGGSTFGSTSASAPSWARMNPARRLRARWTRLPITSDLPAGMDVDDPRRQGPVSHAPEAGLLDHPREGGGRREAADRFHEILIGLGIARHQLSELRDDVEG